jgi:hypothetical protein
MTSMIVFIGKYFENDDRVKGGKIYINFNTIIYECYFNGLWEKPRETISSLLVDFIVMPSNGFTTN